ncbi:hypothetical protein FB451DRAFT_1248995 [Mycena latifolia]|nr:hypothetical protein FB451DRAFT_1248995 [Mycena latifolia]
MLDRARMPTADELDTEPMGRSAGAVARAYTAILALHAICKVPPPVLIFLWPLASDWMQLIILHRHCLPHPAPSEETLCCQFAVFISSIIGGELHGPELHPTDPTLSNMIRTTPGVRVVMSRSWVASLSLRDILALYPSALSLIRTPAGNASDIQEWIDGAGGTQWHLSSLVVQTLDFVVPQPIHAEMSFRALVMFIGQFVRDENRELFAMLLECGLVRALTGMILSRGLAILLLTFNGPAGDRWLVEGLRAGLLPALVSIVQRRSVPRSATRILEVSLPSYSAHYRVITQIELSLSAVMPTIQRLVLSKKVPDCFKTFLQTTGDRIIVRSNYEAGKYASTQACDNMKCGLLLRKSRFRRCSGCARRYYCSEECQTIDWREAGHRAVCESFGKSESDDASTRDRSFMRAVVHHTYEAAKEALFRRQILHLREHPDTDFYCLFNFKSVPPSFGVYRVQDLPCTNPMWVDCIDRARRSGGRMEIHLVHVPDGTHDDVSKGTNGRSKIFPLRSSSADIQTGLRAIAKALPSGREDDRRLEKEIKERVQALIQKTRDVVQIHCV